MTDFLEDKKKEIDNRLRELKPLVDEYNRLEAAATALGGVGAATGGRSRRRGGAARRTTASTSRPRRSTGTAKRGRPRGSGKRAQQAQKFVGEKPGITIAELAEKMGIQANYLYRVMPGLEKEGKVKKRGKGWHPA